MNGFDRAQEAYDNMQAPEFYEDSAEIETVCHKCDNEAITEVFFDTREPRYGYAECENCGHDFEVDL